MYHRLDDVPADFMIFWASFREFSCFTVIFYSRPPTLIVKAALHGQNNLNKHNEMRIYVYIEWNLILK